MLVKIAALIKNEKLISYALVLGFTTLGMMTVTVIAWLERLSKKAKQKRCVSKGFADTLSDE